MYSQEHVPDHNPIDRFFDEQQEPAQSCLQVVRRLILGLNDQMSETWKYDLPFFCYKDRICCCLSLDRTTGKPCITFTENDLPDHPGLVTTDEHDQKKLLIDPETDLDLDTIEHLLGEMVRIAEEKMQQ